MHSGQQVSRREEQLEPRRLPRQVHARTHHSRHSNQLRVEDPRRFAVRQRVHEPENEHGVLRGGQLVQSAQHSAVRDRLERFILRRRGIRFRGCSVSLSARAWSRALKWSTAELCAIRYTHEANGTPYGRNRSIVWKTLANVSAAMSSASCWFPTIRRRYRVTALRYKRYSSPTASVSCLCARSTSAVHVRGHRSDALSLPELPHRLLRCSSAATLRAGGAPTQRPTSAEGGGADYEIASPRIVRGAVCFRRDARPYHSGAGRPHPG